MIVAVHLVFGAVLSLANPDGVTVSGAYVNQDYGYSVELPRGYSAVTPSPLAPNHGFQVLVPECPAAQLWVDASYNATFLTSLDAIADQAVVDAHGPAQPPVRVEKRRLHVAGVPALQASVPGRVAVVLYRAVPGGVGIIYTLSFDAKDTKEGRCMEVFRAVVRGFKLAPITGG